VPAIQPVSGRSFAVAAGHDAGAEAALRLWTDTGNIFDAAVAATLALGVVEPHLFGLGGEVTGLVRVNGETKVLAGATRAPRAMTPAAFGGLGLDVIPGEGLLSAGPPAVLHALLLLLADHGQASFSRVAQPAIELAEDGFEVGELLAEVIDQAADVFRDLWPTSAEIWMPGGAPPKPGTIIRQPAIAESLRRLGNAGDDGLEAVLVELRTGFVAQAILEFGSETRRDSCGEHRSFLSSSDLETFGVGWEAPVTWTDRHGRTVCKAGPWTQGPMLLQQLALMEAGGWDRLSPLDADFLHATVETLKLAFADREGYFGDPAFVSTPIAHLLSGDYVRERAASVDMGTAGDPSPGRVQPDSRPWSTEAHRERGATGDTTHLDLADEEGNLVAFTPSGGWFASPVIPALGFPLGTRCQTFWLDPAHPNHLQPGKRPRTTLTPTIVLEEGRPRYALGTPGGDTQDQIQAQMLHALAAGMTPEEVVELPTVVTNHAPSSFYPHGSEPQGVDVESRIDGSVAAALAERGHRTADAGPWAHGRPHVIEVRPDGLMRAAVSRRLGGTAGVRAV